MTQRVDRALVENLFEAHRREHAMEARGVLPLNCMAVMAYSARTSDAFNREARRGGVVFNAPSKEWKLAS